MISLWMILLIVHLIGLALGVGAATVKVRLLLKCRADQAFIPNYLQVARPITGVLIFGLILLTLSGVGWLLLGAPFTPLLIVKIGLVVLLWIVGPIIDNVVEPRFFELAPVSDRPVTPDFLKAQRRLLVLELQATGLFYLITIMGTLVYA